MFTLQFETDNAAFENYPAAEAARILREVADKVQDGTHEKAIIDINGNTIGGFRLSIT